MLWAEAERGTPCPRSNVPVPSPFVPSTLPFLVLVLVLLFEMLLVSARRAPFADAAPDAAAAAAAGARVTAGLAPRPSVTAGLPLPEEASSSVLYSPSDGPPDDVAVRDPEFLERYEWSESYRSDLSESYALPPDE